MHAVAWIAAYQLRLARKRAAKHGVVVATATGGSSCLGRHKQRAQAAESASGSGGQGGGRERWRGEEEEETRIRNVRYGRSLLEAMSPLEAM